MESASHAAFYAQTAPPGRSHCRHQDLCNMTCLACRRRQQKYQVQQRNTRVWVVWSDTELVFEHSSSVLAAGGAELELVDLRLTAALCGRIR